MGGPGVRVPITQPSPAYIVTCSTPRSPSQRYKSRSPGARSSSLLSGFSALAWLKEPPRDFTPLSA